MRSLTPTSVLARVRPDGAVGPFEPRCFEFMLDAGDEPTTQQREALRILRQIGWQPRGPVQVQPRDLTITR